MVPYHLNSLTYDGHTACGCALGGSDKSLTLGALTRLFGSGLPHAVNKFNDFPENQLTKFCTIFTVM